MLPAIMHNSTQKEQAGWYSGPRFKWTYCMNIVVCVRTYACMDVWMYVWMDVWMYRRALSVLADLPQ